MFIELKFEHKETEWSLLLTMSCNKCDHIIRQKILKYQILRVNLGRLFRKNTRAI